MSYKSAGFGGLLLTAALTIPAPLFAAPAVPAPGESIPAGEPDTGADIRSNLPTEEGRQGEESFTITSVRVEHEGLRLRDEKLRELLAPVTGREITVTELSRGIAALTRYAREQGYPAAAAYIPAQTAVEGSLLVRIAPGRLGKLHIENSSRLRDTVAKGILAGLREGEIIRSRTLEKALRNLGTLSGVEAVGVLSPGAEEGTSDLTVKVADGKRNSLIVYSENYGSKSAGRYRYGLQEELGNLFGGGESLTLGALLSNRRQHGYNISLEIPVGHSATKLGLGFSRSDYELGAEAQALGAEGMTNTYSIFGRTPLINTSRNSLALTYGYDYREITDELTRFDFSWEKHSHIFHVGLEGFSRGKNLSLSYRAGLHTGTLIPDSEAAEALGRLGNTTGRFTKGTLDLTAVQGLGRDFDIMLKLSGQMAANNLDSSEHIYLGGARGVRAYPQGEASGDEGLVGTLELRYHTPVKGLTLSAYFDAGHTLITKSGGDGNMTLKGWGLGLTYTRPGDWFARLDYARRIGSDELMSREAEGRQRVWFMAGKMF